MRCLTLSSILIPVVLAAAAPAAETLSGKVVRVESGDRLVVLVDGKEQTVLLAGVAAPSKSAQLAERAKTNLAAKVTDRAIVAQVLDRDAQQRPRAAVWVERRSINTEVVRDGWAWHDPRRPEFKSLAEAEAEAKAAKRGLWEKEKPEESPPWADAKAADQPPAAASSPEGGTESRELAIDDGKPAGKRSLPQGMAVKFKTPEGKWLLTGVRIHGSRYGHPAPPREKFHVTICDLEYKPLADFVYPYSRFKWSGDNQEWVALKVKPTELPTEFILCVDFNAEATKGVYVSHDAEGKALVGKPNRPAGVFGGGDWLIHAVVQPAK